MSRTSAVDVSIHAVSPELRTGGGGTGAASSAKTRAGTSIASSEAVAASPVFRRVRWIIESPYVWQLVQSHADAVPRHRPLHWHDACQLPRCGDLLASARSCAPRGLAAPLRLRVPSPQNGAGISGAR